MEKVISEQEKFELVNSYLTYYQVGEIIISGDQERMFLLSQNVHMKVISHMLKNHYFLPEKVITNIARNATVDILPAVIANVNLPLGELMRIYYAYAPTKSSVNLSLIGSPRLPLEYAEQLLEDNDSSLYRSIIAARPDVTIELLQKIIRRDLTVNNRGTDVWSEVEYQEILRCIAIKTHNKGYDNFHYLPEEIFSVVLENAIEEVQEIMVSSGNYMSEETINKHTERLAGSRSYMQKAFSGNPLVPVERLEELLTDTMSKEVAKGLAFNPSSTDLIHQFLLQNSKDPIVKVGIARHTKNVDVLRSLLLRTKSAQVIREAERNPLLQQLHTA